MIEIEIPILIVVFIQTAVSLIWFIRLEEKLKMVAESIQHLEKEIEHAATVNAAVKVFLKDLQERLDQLAAHPDAAKIRELAQQLRAQTDALAEAISDHEE